MKKRCKRCGLNKEEKLFYRHRESRDGLLHICKLCKRKYEKSRHSAPSKFIYEQKRSKMPSRKSKQIEYQRVTRKRFPKKWYCRKKVQLALYHGVLVRGVCLVCGDVKTEAHHDDYRKPLDVKWFCRKHHLEYEGKHSNKLE
jgi:hypothetical protein